MRSLSRKLSLFICAAIGLLVAVTISVSSAHPAIDVVASNWKFTPAKIEVHVGEPTVLNLTSSEGVHGIESTDLGIAKTIIVPNKSVAVTFTPAKAGSYNVHCAILCGAGHENMVLTINVVP